MRRLAPGLALIPVPGLAQAHAFQTGADSYALFLQGVGAPWLMLPVALLLIGTGLFLGIWRTEAMLAFWPVQIVVLALVLGLGVFVPGVPDLALVVAALAIAGLGILALPLPRAAALGLGALALLLAGRFLLEDHAFGELPLPFMVGMAAGAASLVALPAGLVQATRERIGHPAVLIGWRALSSWVGAAAILMIAFALRPGA